MNTQLIEVTYNLSTIVFRKFGHGKEVMLAFHGFSENGGSLLVLEPALGERFTVYAMDMPYHGRTIWKEEHHYCKNDLKLIVQALMKQEGFDSFSLLGFSMGGKNAMACTKLFPEMTRNLYLLASDGIKTKAVYNIAVYPSWGRYLFRMVVKNPGWFFGILRMLNRIGILSPWLMKFTLNHMDTLEKRERLYNTWVSMAGFKISIKALKSTLNQFSIPVWLVFGKRDEVIPPKVAHLFADGLEHVNIELIDRGHYFIDEGLIPVLKELV